MKKSRLELLKDMLSVYNLSADWAMKMLGFEKKDIRKDKINKLFKDDKTREI
jgi:hypothetical protein